MKTSFCFLFLLISTSCLAKQNNTLIVQRIFDRIYQSVGLPSPVTVVSCFEEDAKDSIVQLLNTSLPILDSLNITSLQVLTGRLVKLVRSIPQTTQNCLISNVEIEVLMSLIESLNLVPTEIVKRVEELALSNLESNLASANESSEDSEKTVEGSQSYFQVYLKDATEILQELLNGGFEQVNLADPTTIVSCFDDATAQTLVDLIGNVLNQAANGSISDIPKIEQEVQAFADSIPEPVKNCLADNQELISSLKAYNIYGKDPKAVKTKFEEYAILHVEALRKEVAQQNADFQAGNFNAVGKEGGAIVQQIFGPPVDSWFTI